MLDQKRAFESESSLVVVAGFRIQCRSRMDRDRVMRS
jgi:hypothetical protein